MGLTAHGAQAGGIFAVGLRGLPSADRVSTYLTGALMKACWIVLGTTFAESMNLLTDNTTPAVRDAAHWVPVCTVRLFLATQKADRCEDR